MLNEDDMKSRRFWKKVIGIAILLIFIIMCRVIYTIAGIFISIFPNISQLFFYLPLCLFLILIIKVERSMIEELDRRFPLFNNDCSSIGRMMNEITRNSIPDDIN